QFNEYGHMRF
uniref:Sulfakinin-1 n=1 Tax=Rhodnius prolixus TaxID=13249 RepID=SK1_RHOPR|nr:RecName: Full=Sulfakinin-1; Short=Rhopr-SK-1 [Rhodnius prolixus]